MATYNTSATINGIYYSQRTAFYARTNFTGKGSSEGSGGNSTVTAGTQYTFLYYRPGSAYPYAIGLPGHGNTVRCWVQATVFPYATYYVYYNANGGSGAPGWQAKTYGYNLTLSTQRPTRSGYTFKGWATSPSGAVVYSPGGLYTTNAGATLYAVWALNTYEVRYEPNGAPGNPWSEYVGYGTMYNVQPNWYSRAGHTFVGWNERRDGTGTDWTNNIEVAWKWTYTHGVTLYAIWRIDTYKVSYDANGGSGAPAAQTKTYNKTLTLSSQQPTRTGYLFAGWATSKNGNAAYSSGAQYDLNVAITLYAVWAPIKYSVKYNANGGSGQMGNQTHSYAQTKELTTNTYTKKGHSFLGWSLEPGGKKVFDDSARVKNLSHINGDVVELYAVWQANQYTIKFDAATNGGTGSTEQIKTYGTRFGKLPIAYKKYYVFQGWYTRPTGGAKITEDTRVEQNATVYAQFLIDASAYVTVNGKLKPGFPYVWNGKEWKKGYAYVWNGKEWKQGLSE